MYTSPNVANTFRTCSDIYRSYPFFFLAYLSSAASSEIVPALTTFVFPSAVHTGVTGQFTDGFYFSFSTPYKPFTFAFRCQLHTATPAFSTEQTNIVLHLQTNIYRAMISYIPRRPTSRRHSGYAPSTPRPPIPARVYLPARPHPPPALAHPQPASRHHRL